MRIRSFRKYLAVVFACMILLAPMAGVANEDVAKATFAEAVELIEQARQTDSLDERWTFYETARAYLRQIRRSLSGTDLARRLGDEETTERALYDNVKRELLLTGKAVCEQEFTAACVLRFARDVHLIIDVVGADEFLVEISKAQAVAGDISGAFESIETIHSFPFRDALPPIMAAMVKRGELDEALAKAKGLYRRRDRDVALSSIVQALAEKGYVADGRGVAAQIGDAGARSLAVATLAGVSPLDQGGHDPSALFAEALALAETVDDAKARAELLFKIAEIELTVDNIVGARETLAAAFTAARAISEPYDRYHVPYVGYWYSKAEISDAARAVKDEFRKTAAQIDETRNPIDDVLYDAEAKIKMGDIAAAKESLRQAREIALKMESATQRSYNLGRVIRVRALMGDIAGAMADWSLIPLSDKSYSYVRELIARAQAKAGDIEGLNDLLETIDEQPARHRLLKWKIIPELAKNGWLLDAHRFAGEIDKLAWGYSRAMVAIAKAESAAGFFDLALRTARSISTADGRANALSEIAAEHLKKGRASDAKRLLLMAFRGMFGPNGLPPGEGWDYNSGLFAIGRSDVQAFTNIGGQLAEIETRN
ncbi:MAG: hypothetical protein ACE5H8_02150 [Alphaproteobacteria bacterium]